MTCFGLCTLLENGLVLARIYHLIHHLIISFTNYCNPVFKEEILKLNIILRHLEAVKMGAAQISTFAFFGKRKFRI